MLPPPAINQYSPWRASPSRMPLAMGASVTTRRSSWGCCSTHCTSSGCALPTTAGQGGRSRADQATGEHTVTVREGHRVYKNEGCSTDPTSHKWPLLHSHPQESHSSQ